MKPSTIVYHPVLNWLFLAANVSPALLPKIALDRLKPALTPLLSGPPLLLIDTFNDTTRNALGFFHGVSGEARFGEFEELNGGDYLKVTTGDVDGMCWQYHHVCIVADSQSFFCYFACRRMLRFHFLQRSLHSYSIQWFIKMLDIPPTAQQGL